MQLNSDGEIVAEAPVEAPVEAPAEAPVEAPVEVPAEAPVEETPALVSKYNYDCQQQVVTLNNEVIFAHSPAKVAEVLEKFAEITPQNDEEVKAFFLSHQ